MDCMPKSKKVDRDAKRFGELIHRLRTERGWTLVKFGQRSGMNPTYLGVLEKGGNMPSLQTLFELADVFGVSASEMIREIEHMRGRKTAG